MNSIDDNEENENAEESLDGTSVAVEEPVLSKSKDPKTQGRLTIKGGYINTSLDPKNLYKEWPEFSVGDTLKVHYRIIEGEKERIQLYEGNVISIRGEGLGKTFTVRRIAHDVGVERIFPYHSPSIANLQVVRKGLVRRAKLYFLRGKSGKEGRIKERIAQVVSEKAKKKTAAKKKVVAKKKTAKKSPASEKSASNKNKSKTSKKKGKS